MKLLYGLLKKSITGPCGNTTQEFLEFLMDNFRNSYKKPPGMFFRNLFNFRESSREFLRYCAKKARFLLEFLQAFVY